MLNSRAKALWDVRGHLSPRPASEWERDYALALVVVDTAAVMAAAIIANRIRFGDAVPSVEGFSYSAVPLLLVPAWIAVLLMSRAYEPRFLGTGSEEFRRVFDASVRFTAVVALFAYSTKLQLSRGFIGGTLIIGTLLLLLCRYGARKVVHSARAKGRWVRHVLAVGDSEHVAELGAQFARYPAAGYLLIGACQPSGQEPAVVDGRIIETVGGLDSVREAVAETGADTVAVTASRGFTSTVLRRLAWSLEGAGVELVVAPSLTNVAGPRVHIRPVADLPLLHVEEPELTGGRQALKTLVERAFSALALVVLSPLLLAVALAIRLESSGPALFRQERVGRDGALFEVYKFRSMRPNAHELEAQLRAEQDHEGVRFKMARDPRVTRIGACIRRYSIDELPQLLNVLKGEMALVGPRPQQQWEVATYHSDFARRLKVKPGLTGLWQVSGRSDLSAEESERLDLYYVENWSLALDAMIVWKTLFAVVTGRGAY